MKGKYRPRTHRTYPVGTGEEGILTDDLQRVVETFNEKKGTDFSPEDIYGMFDKFSHIESDRRGDIENKHEAASFLQYKPESAQTAYNRLANLNKDWEMGLDISGYDPEDVRSRDKVSNMIPMWFADMYNVAKDADIIGALQGDDESFENVYASHHTNLYEEQGAYDNLTNKMENYEPVPQDHYLPRPDPGANIPQPEMTEFQLGTGKSGIVSLENQIDDLMGNPQLKARGFSKISDDQWEDPVDNMRHVDAGRRTAKWIKEKVDKTWVGKIPLASETAGFLGSNAMGLAHEVAFPNTDVGMKGTIIEGAEDMFNNMVGASMVYGRGSDEEQKSLIRKLSVGNFLPDGYYFENEDKNMYFKHGVEPSKDPIIKGGKTMDIPQQATGGTVTRKRVADAMLKYLNTKHSL